MTTFNSMAGSGQVINDPPYLFNLLIQNLEPSAEMPLGDFQAYYNAKQLIGYLANRGWSVTPKDESEWIAEHKPVLIVVSTKSLRRAFYDHEGNEIPLHYCIQSADHDSGKVGCFVYQGPHFSRHAISPVYSGLPYLFAWMNENGYQRKPGDDPFAVEKVT